MTDDRMKPLFEATRSFVQRFVKKPTEVPKERKDRPIPPLEGMRFFIANENTKGATSFSIVWVDSDESCHQHHETLDDGSWRRMDWHNYSAYDDYYKQWNSTAVRCPMSVHIGRSLDVNTPLGHAEARLATVRRSRVQKITTQADPNEGFD